MSKDPKDYTLADIQSLMADFNSLSNMVDTLTKCRRCGKPLHLRNSCSEWGCPALDALRLKDQLI